MSVTAMAVTVSAGAAFLAIIGSVLTLAYRTGVLNGSVMAFMRQAEQHRTEVLTEIGKLDERMDHHMDAHARGRS